MEKPWNPKLYIVTRKDLPDGVQACQAIHAMTEFAHNHPEIEKTWYETSNYVCLLSVKDMKELEEYTHMASAKDIKFSCFFEPDLENELTAVAFEPIIETRDLLADLNLALRDKKKNKWCSLL